MTAPGRGPRPAEEEFARARPTREQFRRIGRFLRPYRQVLLLGLLFQLLWCASMALQPMLIRSAIDDYLLGDGGFRGLLWVCSLYALNGLTRTLGNGRQLRMVARVGQSFLTDLRNRVFAHVQGLSMGFFDRTLQGRIIARCDRDVDAIERIVTWGPITFLSSIFMMLLGVTAMVVIYPLMSLVVVCCIPSLFVSSEIFRRIGLRTHRDRRAANSMMTAHFAETINGMGVIRASVQEGRNIARGNRVIDHYLATSIRAIRVWSTFVPIVATHYRLAQGVILIVGGWFVANGKMTVGDLAAFIFLVDLVFSPIEELGELYNELLSAAAASERVFEVLDTSPEIVDRPGALPLADPHGAVRFESVSFRYGEDMPRVLHDVSFDVAPGSTVALVGETGAGKSTVVGLICRFYEAQEGVVSIDGIDVRDLRLDAMRSRIGMIPQDGYLFYGTVMENLRFGRPGATDSEVIEAARTLGADRLISSLSSGYRTGVGERGSKLSHGQRQVVCYTRALLADPAILILDEATSALDAYSEKTLQDALARLSEGRTTIIVAHRLSTIIHADSILVMENGRLVQQGRHGELIAEPGRYRRLYSEYSSGQA